MDSLKPVYLLAGGRPRNPLTLNPLLQAVYRESGKVLPSIAYVGVANEDSKAFYLMMASALKAAGAGRIKHALITPPKADLKKAEAIMESSDIVYISGGDVERGMQILQEKRMLEFLLELYHGGKLFFGLSAGSIMLAKEWVRWRNPEDDTTAEIFPCLNIAPVVCDTHGEQDNWEELQALMKMERNNTKGYGIVSGTAIKVYYDGQVEAMGGAVHQFINNSGTVQRIEDLKHTLR